MCSQSLCIEIGLKITNASECVFIMRTTTYQSSLLDTPYKAGTCVHHMKNYKESLQLRRDAKKAKGMS